MGDDGALGRVESERLRLEENITARTHFVGQHIRHLTVGQRSVKIVALIAELAKVEQGHDVERRQQAIFELINIAEENLVGLFHVGTIDRQFDE